MKKTFYLLMIVLLVSCCGKTDPPPITKVDSNNLNVSILIDLSDRIDSIANPNPTINIFNGIQNTSKPSRRDF